MDTCVHCLKGKKFNVMAMGNIKSESYILGNELTTYMINQFDNTDKYSIAKITHCPMCGTVVQEEPNEEMEEEIDD